MLAFMWGSWTIAVLLGLIEGICEFLPISSTGHLLIAEHFLPRQSDVFNTIIQTGAVVAVIATFAQRLKLLTLNFASDAAVRSNVYQLAIAFLITAIGGIVLHHQQWQLPETIAPVAWATLLGGLLLVISEWRPHQRPARPLVYSDAVWAGLAQLLAAVCPGTSRSGSCILVLMWRGVDRRLATDFTFLLGIPTLLAAGAVKLLTSLANPAAPAEHWQFMIVATVVAALSALWVVRWLLNYVREHSFMVFGVYRIVLGIALLLMNQFELT